MQTGRTQVRRGQSTSQQTAIGTDNRFSGQVIDCSTTASCSELNINLNSTCITDSTTWDNNFGGSIQAQIPLWFNKDASATGSLTYDHSFGGAHDVQMCTTDSDTGYEKDQELIQVLCS